MTSDKNIAPPELEIAALGSKGYKLRDWLTTYPMLLVAVDPYTSESSWILDTAVRIFDHFNPADVRVGWICTADEAGTKQFLGPLADRFLTIVDPERKIVSELHLERLPSLVHIRSDGYLQQVDGWDPKEWSNVCDWLATILAWSKINLGMPGDPGPYKGTPVMG